MKKFLSLVLTLALTMSLVTVSAGATDFDDDGDITYQEAVTVIAGLGIVDGYSDGSFGPDEVLTRGAAAKIICNLILGPTTASALSASSAPFIDVPVTNTFAGYITYCSQAGIISGYADGTFRPSGTLSGNAFMKMLLGALGYDSESEGYTGPNWNVAVIKQAVGIDLDDGNDDFLGSQAVTREEACLYAFNTLQATMVEYDTKNTVIVGDVQVSTTSTRSDVENNTSSDGNIDNDGLMQFAEEYFTDLTAEDDTDDFGRPATNWVYDGDDLGTYANDADATCVVDEAGETLSSLATDGDYLDYDSDDILDDAVVYYNGMAVDGDDSLYEDNYSRTDLAGKGDILEAFENDDGDVDTIVIRSYTYAMIDSVDNDLSSSQKSDGATTGLDLVDIDGDSLGNGTYYDDYDDEEYILIGYTGSYTEGTALAVALGEDDAVLDSYVMETVTGTPSAARTVEVYGYITDGAGNLYYTADRGVKNGSITIDGTKYTYAAQFTGLPVGGEVDFDEEYTVYLTDEGYALAVDGDAAISLKDVYFVVGLYAETSRGSTSYYAQAISVTDGAEHELRLDYKDIDGGKDAEEQIQDAFGLSSKPNLSSYVVVRDLYELDEDSNKYTVVGSGAWDGNSSYDVATGALSDDVTSGDSVIRFDGNRTYIQDDTFFIGAESYGDDLDVSTATGMMSAKYTNDDDNPVVFSIMDGSDAVFVIYASDDLVGATDKDDVVYMADDASTRNSSDTYLVDLYFLSDMSLAEDTVIDDDEDEQGFYTYSVSDDVYDLDRGAEELYYTDETHNNTEDGYAEYVVLNEGRNSTVTSVTSGDDFDAAEDVVGSAYIFDDVAFDAYSISGATVVDTRSDSNRDNDLYTNNINNTSRLISALDRGWVVADIYVDDGEIIFVAVRECEDSASAGSDATITAGNVDVVAGRTATGTFSISSGTIDSVVSNNTSVATVSGSTGSSSYTYTVSGVSAGTTTLTITGTGANGNTVRKSVTVTVTSGAEDIVLSDDAVEVTIDGTSSYLSAALTGGTILAVESDDTDTATVGSASGVGSSATSAFKVTGVAAGTTTITVTGLTESGSVVTAQITVKVLNNDTTLNADSVEAALNADEANYTAAASNSGGTITVTLTKKDGEASVAPKDGDTITLSFETQNDQKSVGTINLVYDGTTDSRWEIDGNEVDSITGVSVNVAVVAEDGTSNNTSVTVKLTTST